ncbi:ABC transporter ATP-binding protein [Microbacterium thalassium]|uniref:Branched-chain amino acid transport system ATP-binding protein n=1 Tax=Microbacterium thalassium TaxID=362649 RepID=A0A7X0FNL1_9MICO|nr:ABC transporter ATP-binding protein [Microbacterium thalassium]MBB6390804.1 branched-chain amino acid transport system ATP-binding protein [Microbacterium thalassium]GLK25912.1 ABC transporter ATP-binding protein [Microbacterium thalassium]
MNAILEVAEVELSFGGVRALDGPSFTVGEGEIVGLIGPNGAGKTSLFNCINGLYRPQSGMIRVGGRHVIGMPRHRITDLGVSRTFQNIGLLMSQTVLENVMAGTYHVSHGGYWATALALPQVKRSERSQRASAMAVLDALGLAGAADVPVAVLPFGTLKRVELARALVSEPRLLLIDEPANGLIHSEVLELADTIRRLARERGTAILLVEHHMALVMRVCDRVVVLNLGRKIAEGEPADVANDPAVVAAYLGGAAA